MIKSTKIESNNLAKMIDDLISGEDQSISVIEFNSIVLKKNKPLMAATEKHLAYLDDQGELFSPFVWVDLDCVKSQFHGNVDEIEEMALAALCQTIVASIFDELTISQNYDRITDKLACRGAKMVLIYHVESMKMNIAYWWNLTELCKSFLRMGLTPVFITDDEYGKRLRVRFSDKQSKEYEWKFYTCDYRDSIQSYTEDLDLILRHIYPEDINVEDKRIGKDFTECLYEYTGGCRKQSSQTLEMIIDLVEDEIINISTDDNKADQSIMFDRYLFEQYLSA